MKFSIKSFLIPTQILLIAFVGRIFCAVCPAPADIKPCHCNEKDSQLICSGNSVFDLKKVFSTIGANGGKHFNEFMLTNSAIPSLEDYVFGNVSFSKISITGAYGLTKISKMALIASSQTLEEFRQMGESQLNDDHIEELFEALSSLTYVNRIFLELTHATKVPDNAFKIVNGRQSRLETIHLNYIGGRFGSLQSIGNRAFYYLDNLRYVSIANQPIKILKAQSFDFEKPSTIDFDLHLEATKVNDSSFEEGIFLNSKRPMTIEMSENNMDSLDEKIFKPILELPSSKMITLIVENNPFECDCRMEWLVKGKNEFKYRVLEPNCISTGDSIFELDTSSSRFSNCHGL